MSGALDCLLIPPSSFLDSGGGKGNRRRRPRSGVLSSAIVPPCSSTIRCRAARPIPVPPGLVEKNSSKMRGSTSAGIAGPRCEGGSARRRRAAHRRQSEVAPLGAASIAFTRMLLKTWASCSVSSAQRVGGAARQAGRPSALLSRRPRCSSSTSSKRRPDRRGEGGPGWPAVLKQRSHHRVEPLDFAEDPADVLSTTGSSRMRKRRSWAADEMPKSGLRSSCATPTLPSPIASRSPHLLDAPARARASMAAAVAAATVASTRRASATRCGASRISKWSVIAPTTRMTRAQRFRHRRGELEPPTDVPRDDPARSQRFGPSRAQRALQSVGRRAVAPAPRSPVVH